MDPGGLGRAYGPSALVHLPFWRAEGKSHAWGLLKHWPTHSGSPSHNSCMEFEQVQTVLRSHHADQHPKGVLTVKSTPLLPRPPTVTITLPVVAPAGTCTLMLVLLQELTVADTPLSVTVLVPCEVPKFVPSNDNPHLNRALRNRNAADARRSALCDRQRRDCRPHCQDIGEILHTSLLCHISSNRLIVISLRFNSYRNNVRVH